MAEEEILARLNVTGASAFRRDMQMAGTAVRGVGAGAGAALTRLDRLGSGFDRTAKRAAQFGLAVGGLGVAAGLRKGVGAGFAYNKMLDSQRIGFTSLLGSQKKAADFMKQIQQLALDSPVLDPKSTGDAARQMINFGVNAKQALPFVKALGDVSAASGHDVGEAMLRGSTALGQIAGKGVLQMQDLRQLVEGAGFNIKLLPKQLGMTQKAFAKTFSPGNNLKAAKALPGILKAMQEQAGGAAEALSKTPQGQFARLQETGSKMMGQITRGIYDEAGKTAGQLGDRLSKIWASGADFDPLSGSGGQTTLGQRLSQSIRVSKPIIGRAIDDLDLKEHFADAFNYVGLNAPKWIWAGFKSAPPLAQGTIALVVAKKLGLVGALGGALTGMAKGKLGGGGGSTGVLNVRAGVVNVTGGAGGVPGATGGGGASRAGKVLRAVPFVAGAVAGAEAYGKHLDRTNGKGTIGNATTRGGINPASVLAQRQRAAQDRRAGRVTGSVPNLTDTLPGAARSPLGYTTPNARGGSGRLRGNGKAIVNLTIPVKINQRELGKAVTSIVAQDAATG